jgi:uncharacterized protein (DUF2267 family)
MTDTTNLEDFYRHVQQEGKLITEGNAKRWADGVLRTLGVNLDRGTKKKLAAALPEDLATSLTRVFWLLHFRDPDLTAQEFQQMVARRSGNTDADFAYYPTRAVFAGIKRMISDDLNKGVAETLAPEIRELWQQA